MEQHGVGLEAEVVDEPQPLAGRVGKGQAGVQPTGHGPVAVGQYGLRLALADQGLSGLDRQPPVAPVRPALARRGREDLAVDDRRQGRHLDRVGLLRVPLHGDRLGNLVDDEADPRGNAPGSDQPQVVFAQLGVRGDGDGDAHRFRGANVAADPRPRRRLGRAGLRLGLGIRLLFRRAAARVSPLPETQTAVAPLSCWPATVASTVLPNCPPAG